MSHLVLVDKSALARSSVIEPVEGDGELCLCAVTRLEVLFSARFGTDYAELEEALDAFRHLRVNAETFAIAAGAQRELAGVGQHRVAIPDLLIAACAQQHSADVLHVDRHFDTLARVLDFSPLRLNSENWRQERHEDR